MNFLIATIKQWNIDNFHKYKKDNWYLATTSEELEKSCKELNPRLLFIPHWNLKIPENIYSRFETVIFHMTDLPLGKGREPLQWLIESRYTQTVLTVFRCADGMDTGPIYKKIPFSLSGSAEECYIRCSHLIFENINIMINLANKGIFTPHIQIGTPSDCGHPTPEILLDAIDSLEELYNKIRAWDAESYPKANFDVDEFNFEFSNAIMRHNCIEAHVRIKINDT